MQSRVKILNNYAIGSVLSYSPENLGWEIAQNLNLHIGILTEVFQDQETLEYEGTIVLSGEAYAIASEDIPDEGGRIKINNGGVYVNNTAYNCGIIPPIELGQVSRIQGDLVKVHIR